MCQVLGAERGHLHLPQQQSSFKVLQEWAMERNRDNIKSSQPKCCHGDTVHLVTHYVGKEFSFGSDNP